MTGARNQKWYSYQKKWYLSHFAIAIRILMRKGRIRALLSYFGLSPASWSQAPINLLSSSKMMVDEIVDDSGARSVEQEGGADAVACGVRRGSRSRGLLTRVGQGSGWAPEWRAGRG